MTKRLLVVDDDADMRLTLKLALEIAGYGVEVAANGKEALEAQRRRPADVLITDIFMPEKEGIETIQQIRKDGRGVKIIAASGGGAARLDLLPLAIKSGADHTIGKPFDQQELLALVQRALHGA